MDVLPNYHLIIKCHHTTSPEWALVSFTICLHICLLLFTVIFLIPLVSSSKSSNQRFRGLILLWTVNKLVMIYDFRQVPYKSYGIKDIGKILEHRFWSWNRLWISAERRGWYLSCVDWIPNQFKLMIIIIYSLWGPGPINWLLASLPLVRRQR